MLASAEPARSIADVLLMRATSTPGRTAYTFVHDDVLSEMITCQELAAAAAAQAARILDATQTGDRVLIALEAGVDYIVALFACFMAGRVAVPTLPPRTARRRALVDAIVADCSPALVIAEPDQALDLPDAIPRLYVCEDNAEPAATLSPRAGRDDLALLQYTSGSTGQPKGVMVRHGNLLDNLEHQRRVYGAGPESSGVIWLPPHHDMGLGSGVLQPLYAGSSMVLASPLWTMQRPLRWLGLVHEHGATVSGGPPSAFGACVAAAQRSAPENLDLSNWRCAFVGAEPVSLAVLETFAETFAPYGFERSALQPCYGLAEATLLVTGARLGNGASLHPACPGTRPKVNCGRAAADHDLVIVNPDTCTPRLAGEEGEIWLRGPSVAAGYWRNADATEETFRARLADGSGPYLRTGDLGVLLDGELAVTGRLKDIIIFAGRNVHACDVEAAVLSLGAMVEHVTGVAAFALSEDQGERLGVLLEVRRMTGTETAAVAVAQQLSHEFGVGAPALGFVPTGSLPRTSSGKIRRHLCPDLYRATCNVGDAA
jgi:acyl-CoA synthetase (AMP-forming)/AMP-acid ligase II